METEIQNYTSYVAFSLWSQNINVSCRFSSPFNYRAELLIKLVLKLCDKGVVTESWINNFLFICVV